MCVCVFVCQAIDDNDLIKSHTSDKFYKYKLFLANRKWMLHPPRVQFIVNMEE